MKTTKRISIFMLAASMAAAAVAQDIPLNEAHRLSLDALRLLETYEQNASLRNNEAADMFKSVFGSESKFIYNDLLGVSDEAELPVGRYVDLMRANVTSPLVTLKNVRKKSMTDHGDKWEIVLTFDKEMRYNSRCGAILSSKGYYDADYAMEARIVKDKATGVCTIESLTGNIDSPKPRLNTNFAIVEYSDPRDREVTNNGKPLEFNTFDQAFIPMPYKLKYSDADANMKVKVLDPDCNLLQLSYRPRRWKFKPHFDLSLGDAYSIGDLPNGFSTTMSNTEFGLDLGYVFPSKKRLKVSFNFGVGLSNGNIDFNADNVSYYYRDTDKDDNAYRRYYTLEGVKETVKLTHLFVPIYFDFDFRIHTYVSAYIRLGAKAYVDMGSKIDSYSGSADTYGIIPEYGDMPIYEPQLGFGTVALNRLENEEIDFHKVSFDAFGGIGVNVKVVGPLYVEAGVTYNYGITSLLGNDDPIQLRSGQIEKYQAPVYYENTGITYSRSLTDYIGSVKRNALKLNLGLILKF